MDEGAPRRPGSPAPTPARDGLSAERSSATRTVPTSPRVRVRPSSRRPSTTGRDIHRPNEIAGNLLLPESATPLTALAERRRASRDLAGDRATYLRSEDPAGAVSSTEAPA